MPRESSAPNGPSPIRDAATLILVRYIPDHPIQVLMGQRGTDAAFMPDKFVFPGGAIDAADLALDAGPHVDAETARRLEIDTEPATARALGLTAIRELWEETGLMLGHPDPKARTLAETAPPVWRGFFEAGLLPHTAALSHVFRAITPPGRPRRFDARFFLADARHVAGDIDGFALADGELRHLQWLDLDAARALALPFITEVVLAEIAAMHVALDTPRPAPFFHHSAEGSYFRML